MEAEQKLKDLKIKFLDMLSEINNTADQILTKRKNSEHLLSKENKNLRQNERETKSTQNHFFDYSEFSNKKHKFLERHFSQFTPKLSKPEKIVSENEKRILRDVLFVMQGINGDFFKINSSTNLAELKNDDIFQNKEFERISQTAIMASLECCECGIYYKNIVNVLNMKETGQILKSVFEEIQNNLFLYHQMLTQLEHLIDGKKSDQNLLNGFDPPLTIPKLLVISREAAQKLKFISNVCDSIKNLKGTAACSELYLISENEFGQFDQIAKSYFEKSLKPVWKISSNWLLNGQISDAFSEFYIRKNELGKFELREEMIPNFIPEKTIEQILQIGRTVNYIRTHTKGDVKIFDLSKETIKFSQPEKIPKQIEKMKQQIGIYFFKILFKNFYFENHFDNIKGFFLLSNGDFINNLLNLAKDEMFKNSNSVKAEALDPLIQKSLLTHLYTNDKKEIQNEFNLRFFKLQNKDSITVLDIFCFTYDLNPKNPLKIIFDDSSLSKYKTIFNFLWKFKFAQKLMSAQFAINSEISKRFLSFKGPKTEKINGANTILSKFVFNATILLNRISKLLFYGAVETSCKNFLTKCKTSVTITDLKENHLKFLNDLEKIIFGGKQMFHIVICIVQSVIHLFKHCAALKNLVNSYKFLENDEFETKLEKIILSVEENQRSFIKFAMAVESLMKDNKKYFC